MACKFDVCSEQEIPVMTNSKPLVIIGAGPAGLAAANVAGSIGIDTLLIDDQKAAGGQIYRGIASASPKLLSALGSEYDHGRTLLNSPDATSVTRLTETTVWQITEDRMIYYSGAKGSDYVQAEQLILATGALERPMPFPGWTLPGCDDGGRCTDSSENRRISAKWQAHTGRKWPIAVSTRSANTWMPGVKSPH